ncbi:MULTISPECIES: UDP-N-acetylmuramate--L-alanine ligase [unclassified Leeuwenhoekiella]|uniref:UDP-N-acetylmuramate--L-alanine ligase n=1 Tax=unclassified Leeuwenhoekiella TaxID=2615029 RepID=UPI000C61884E|nr:MULTISPECIES: UDP-N-acetylmuramate--L-alanine ligase [unclassified Leeuwenhoekiella]MAW96502.1 UDP-N-acetylmuramate--L-alanine ligase [Leeuwenhoekiella sp.]MBA81389.1 UDP-N-acetylmuramate--L-alanine ligase [Leeuwenhoekiella sp.]
MKNLDNISHFYFIGIGGIGMSALARYFSAAGKVVAGYDKTASGITDALKDLGITISFENSEEAIPSEFKNKETTLVVYTPAVPKAHKGYQYFAQHNFHIEKRAAVLGLLTQEKFCLAVAGTHGKTTTSAMLGHLMAACDLPVTAFLGGIAENYQSNLIQQGEEIIVVEADEFDRSFMQLYPNIAAITSMDADHLDIYGDAESLQQSFRDFASQVKEDGVLFVKNGLPLDGISVGVEDDAAYTALNIKIENGAYRFDLKHPDGLTKDLVLNLPGRHNLSNAIIALAMALRYGCPADKLAKALFAFKGVNRRFTYRIKTDEQVLIDDYAHHPAEIDAVHSAVREMYPGKRVLAVFQPHLYSRTRDFMEDFATSLSQFDEVLLLDIYPAREEPIPGMNAQKLLDLITTPRKELVSKGQLQQKIETSEASVILMMGAGDIGEEILKLTKTLEL